MKDRSKVLGGLARAKALSPTRRSEIARKAARTRWGTGLPPAGADAGPALPDPDLPELTDRLGRKLFDDDLERLHQLVVDGLDYIAEAQAQLSRARDNFRDIEKKLK